MFVTLLGISTLVRFVHARKAFFSILIMLLGISILLRFVQFEKALSPMHVTLKMTSLCIISLGITISPVYLLSFATTVAVCVSYTTLYLIPSIVAYSE